MAIGSGELTLCSVDAHASVYAVGSVVVLVGLSSPIAKHLMSRVPKVHPSLP